MWVEFKSLEKKTDLVSRNTGKQYTGYVLKGTRKGYDGEEDTDYERIFLDISTVTTIEYGIERPNQSAVQYIQHKFSPGDTMILSFKLVKGKQMLMSIEKYGERAGASTIPAYEPLTPEQANQIREQQGITKNMVSPSETLPWIKAS